MFWNENRTTELLFNFLGEKIKNKTGKNYKPTKEGNRENTAQWDDVFLLASPPQ